MDSHRSPDVGQFPQRVRSDEVQYYYRRQRQNERKRSVIEIVIFHVILEEEKKRKNKKIRRLAILLGIYDSNFVVSWNRAFLLRIPYFEMQTRYMSLRNLWLIDARLPALRAGFPLERFSIMSKLKYNYILIDQWIFGDEQPWA